MAGAADIIIAQCRNTAADSAADVSDAHAAAKAACSSQSAFLVKPRVFPAGTENALGAVKASVVISRRFFFYVHFFISSKKPPVLSDRGQIIAVPPLHTPASRQKSQRVHSTQALYRALPS